jgi:hypothetical protein
MKAWERLQSVAVKYQRILGVLLSVIALIVAVVFLQIIPDEASMVQGIQRFILVYGHSLCWVLLSIAAMLWGYLGQSPWVGRIAYLALAVYLLFLATLLRLF